MAAAAIAYGGLAAFQMISGFQQAETLREQARLKQKIDDMNAEDALIDAWNAEVFGFTEAARYQGVIDSTIADQRAAFAAQDVDVSYGTAAEVQRESRLVGQLNVIDIKRKAYERAIGFKNEARNFRLGGAATRAQGAINAGAAQTQGITSAASTVASGYSSGAFGKASGGDFSADYRKGNLDADSDY